MVGAAGGLGGFFPPLVMGIVKSATGGYAIGFVLMAAGRSRAWPCSAPFAPHNALHRRAAPRRAAPTRG